LAAVLAAACASASAVGSDPNTDRVLATSDAGVLRDDDRIAHPKVALEISADSAFKLLPLAYKAVGVEATYSDPALLKVGNRDFTRVGRLGDVLLHNYVGCGTTMTGLAADNYRVQLSLISYVSAKGTGSSVQTALTARATDPSASKGWISCLSTQVLENRVNKMLTEISRPY
jgi:hypothetical protein